MSCFGTSSGYAQLPYKNSSKAASNGREVVHRSLVSESVNW